MKKKIYIAGPITPRQTGLATEYIRNCRMFFEAHNFLSLLHFNPYNPAADFLTLLFADEKNQDEIVNNSFEWLDVCQAIALLPGWENSEGTKRELRRAIELGLDVYMLHYDEVSGWSIDEYEKPESLRK